MKRNNLKKYILPATMLIVFETVAITLWLTKNNIFYLFNFSYIGISITLGLVLFAQNYKHARRVVQLLVGLYMLIYLGLICNENMQIEGFWYYLFTGVFEAATIHYAVAKIFGPLIFGRGWCGYACWTAMVLDFLPYKTPDHILTLPSEKDFSGSLSMYVQHVTVLFCVQHVHFLCKNSLKRISGHASAKIPEYPSAFRNF